MSVPDTAGAQFTGGPLDGKRLELPRFMLGEELHLHGWQLAPVLGGKPGDYESAVYHRDLSLVVNRDEAGIWVRYDFGPRPGIALPAEIDMRPTLRHVINDALEAWRDVSDREMPSWWYDPDELKELARHIRNAIIAKLE